MTDRLPTPEAIEEAYEDGSFKADIYIQSLHDHGAAMRQEEAYTAFNETLNELIDEGVQTGFDTLAAKRLEGFTCRIGGRLWQLVAKGETETTAGQAIDLIHRAQAKAGAVTDGLDDYQRGGLAFKTLLQELAVQQRLNLAASGDIQPGAFVPLLRAGFAKPMGAEMDKGFWDAFGIFLELWLDGTDLFLDRWNVMADLAGNSEEGGNHE